MRLSISALVAASALIVCLSRPAVVWAEANPGGDATQRVSVSVDPRVELYSVVLLLSGFNGPRPDAPALTRYEFPYKREIHERFGPYSDHPAVRLYQRFASRGFWLTHPPAVMIHLSDPPALELQHPVDELRVLMAGGPDSLALFLDAMRQFARDSDFMEFFDAHRGMYGRMVADYRTRLKPELVDALEEYFGARQNRYNIILSPLFMPGGFGPRVEVQKNVFDSYFISGPYFLSDDSLAGFQPDIHLVLHEFGHSFVNCQTDTHIGELIGPWTTLDPGSKAEIEKYGFPWSLHVSDQVSENVNRATEARIWEKIEGTKADTVSIKKWNRGFPYVVRVYERLAEYDANRDKYPTFKEFYPRIVEVFEQAAAEKSAGK